MFTYIVLILDCNLFQGKKKEETTVYFVVYFSVTFSNPICILLAAKKMFHKCNSYFFEFPSWNFTGSVNNWRINLNSLLNPTNFSMIWLLPKLWFICGLLSGCFLLQCLSSYWPRTCDWLSWAHTPLSLPPTLFYCYLLAVCFKNSAHVFSFVKCTLSPLTQVEMTTIMCAFFVLTISESNFNHTTLHIWFCTVLLYPLLFLYLYLYLYHPHLYLYLYSYPYLYLYLYRGVSI